MWLFLILHPPWGFISFGRVLCCFCINVQHVLSTAGRDLLSVWRDVRRQQSQQTNHVAEHALLYSQCHFCIQFSGFPFPVAPICISLLFSVPYSTGRRSCWQKRNHLGSQTEAISLSPGTKATVWCCWLPKAEDLGWAAMLQTTIEHPWHGAEHTRCMTPPGLVQWSSIDGYHMRYMIRI